MKIWDHKILPMTKTLTKLRIRTKFKNKNIAFPSWHQHYLRPPVIKNTRYKLIINRLNQFLSFD